MPGKYFGHPNPSRQECVFKDGSWQQVAPPANYVPPMFVLGNNKSANGTVEYTANAFFGALKGELLIANYSVGDDITRVRLSSDGQSVVSSSSLAGSFNDPLPLALGPDGTIYVGELGGNLVTALDPRFGRWFSAPSLSFARHETSAAAIGNKLYVVAGRETLAVEEYDTTTKTWRLVAPLPETLDHVGLVAVNNKLYVFGGLENFPQPVSGDVYEFDPAAGPTGTWTKISDMPIPVGGMAIDAHQGMIYIAGGFAGNHDSVLSTSNFWRFNPVARTWQQLPDLPTPRDHPGGRFIGAKFYVVGGRNNGDPFGRLGTLEVFDPATNQWTANLPAMPTPRRGMSTVVYRRPARGHRRGEESSDSHPSIRRSGSLRSGDEQLDEHGVNVDATSRNRSCSHQRKDLCRRRLDRPIEPRRDEHHGGLVVRQYAIVSGCGASPQQAGSVNGRHEG